MAENYFVRAIGSWVTKNFDLMSHEEALELLKSEHERLQSEHGDIMDYDELDLEEESFVMYGEEKFQTMVLVPENTKTGLEFYLEEITRETERAADFAWCYEYELQDMQGVYDTLSMIRELVGKIQAAAIAQPRYIGMCRDLVSGGYGASFTTNCGPVLAYERAKENARNTNEYAKREVFDVSDVRVMRIDDILFRGTPGEISMYDRQLLGEFLLSHKDKKGDQKHEND